MGTAKKLLKPRESAKRIEQLTWSNVWYRSTSDKIERFGILIASDDRCLQITLLDRERLIDCECLWRLPVVRNRHVRVGASVVIRKDDGHPNVRIFQLQHKDTTAFIREKCAIDRLSCDSSPHDRKSVIPGYEILAFNIEESGADISPKLEPTGPIIERSIARLLTHVCLRFLLSSSGGTGADRPPNG